MSAVNLASGAPSSPLSVAAMVSGQGRGSNLGALIDAYAAATIGACMVLVIATRADAPAAERARNAGVPLSIVSPRRFEQDDEAYGEALLRLMRKSAIDLICLAGYTRMLPPAVVDQYRGRIMNIHPGLLPFFGGKGMYGERVHQAVLESGMKVSGCSVHFVDEEYDTGPIIIQIPVPVLEDDTPSSLGQRVLTQEHAAYVQAVQLFAEGRLRIDGRHVRVLSNRAEGVTE